MPDRCRWWPSVSCPLFWHCSQCRKDKPVYVAHGLALFSRLLRILVCWRWCVCSLCGGGVAYPLALRDVTGVASGDGGLQAWLVLAQGRVTRAGVVPALGGYGLAPLVVTHSSSQMSSGRR